jgi:hypothetical protein
MKRQSFRPLIVLLLASVASIAHAAAPLPWTATSVRGTAVYLASGEWQEVTRGVALSDPALRTLRSGQLVLARSDAELQIGPNSAVQFSTNVRSSATTIQQYSGALALTIAENGSGTIMVVAGSLIVVNIDGEIALTMDEASKRVDLTVKSGAVSVRSGNHDFVSVAAGHVVVNAGDQLSVLVAQAPTSADGDKSIAGGTSGGVATSSILLAEDSANNEAVPGAPGANNASSSSAGGGSGNGGSSSNASSGTNGSSSNASSGTSGSSSNASSSGKSSSGSNASSGKSGSSSGASSGGKSGSSSNAGSSGNNGSSSNAGSSGNNGSSSNASSSGNNGSSSDASSGNNGSSSNASSSGNNGSSSDASSGNNGSSSDASNGNNGSSSNASSSGNNGSSSDASSGNNGSNSNGSSGKSKNK